MDGADGRYDPHVECAPWKTRSSVLVLSLDTFSHHRSAREPGPVAYSREKCSGHVHNLLRLNKPIPEKYLNHFKAASFG